jgi:hypothetical protein
MATVPPHMPSPTLLENEDAATDTCDVPSPTYSALPFVLSPGLPSLPSHAQRV